MRTTLYVTAVLRTVRRETNQPGQIVTFSSNSNPRDYARLRELLLAKEPAAVRQYLMQPRQGVLYARGTGVIDLGQFLHGQGRHLVDRTPLADHQAYMHLDEYLIADNRRRMGFSATSEEIAEHLLRQWPRRDLLLKLVELNRVRQLPAESLHCEATYLTHLPPSAAYRYIGLRGGDEVVPRVFIARQLLLLAMRRVLVEPEPSVPGRTIDLDTTAIMLSHALASGLERMPTVPEGHTEIPADVLLEVVRNGVFNSTDDLVSRLDRHWRVWSEGPIVPIKTSFAAPPSKMVEQAIGIDLEHALMYGMIFSSSVMGWAPGDPVHAPALTGPGFDQVKVSSFMAYVAANETDLATRLTGQGGSWAFLPFEQSPVIDFGDGTVVVLDNDYLVDRVTRGLFWPVHDFEKARSEQARRIWSIGYSQLIEGTILDQLQKITAPVQVVGGPAQQTYFSEDEIRAAFIPKGKRGAGRKHCDAAIWTPECWFAVEIVNRSLTVATRHLGDLKAFRDDTQKMVLEKLEQLDATAEDLISDDSRLSGLPQSTKIEVQPVLIQGGRFPVHPATIDYIDREMDNRHLLKRARVRRLAIIHMDEVEMLEAAAERGERVADIFVRWQRSTRRALPLKNFIIAEAGSVPMTHHRPARLDLRRLKHILDQLPGGPVQTGMRG